MNGAAPCCLCSRGVPAAEAAVSRRALGAVLCWRCRTPAGPDHEQEAGLEAREVGGYGLWTVSRAGAFVAGGVTREGALYRARLVIETS